MTFSCGVDFVDLKNGTYGFINNPPLFDDLKNIFEESKYTYYNLISSIRSKSVAIFSICQLYINMIYNNNDSHCFIFGSYHTLFISFCFKYVGSFFGDPAPIQIQTFDNCVVDETFNALSSYKNINDFYYPSFHFNKLNSY